MTTTKKKGQVPLPEYQPKAFRNLLTLLGENDAGLEWLEVAIRELLQRQRDGVPSATNALALQHGVRVNDLDGESLRSHWAKLQIGSVAQYLEMFLDNLRVELPRETRQRLNKEDLVTYTLEIYRVKKADTGDLQFGLLSYYRRVRNRFVHDPDAEEPKKLIREAEALRERTRGEESPYKSLSAPNAPEAVSFDDFVLFSRALKDFAKRLCTAIVVTDEELKSKLVVNRALGSSLKRQIEPQRRTKLLANYLRENFGFHRTAEAISQRLLDDGLLAQW